MATPTLIGLGSNLGDRRAILDGAVSAMASIPGIEVRAVSSYHETAPVGGPAGQGPFLNAAAVVATTLSPSELHDCLKGIEREAGRVRVVRWGERTLDLDLLLFGDWIIEDESLTIPHPRMAVRRFVLAPAAEVAPDSVHPVTGWTIAKLLANLDRRPSLLVLRWRPATAQGIFEEVVRHLDALAIGDGSWMPRLALDLRCDDRSTSADWIALFRDELLQFREDFAPRLLDVGDRWIVADRHPDFLFPSVHYLLSPSDQFWGEVEGAKRKMLSPTIVVYRPGRSRNAWMSFWADKYSRRPQPVFDFPIIRPSARGKEAIVDEIVAACLASRPSTGNP